MQACAKPNALRNEQAMWERSIILTSIRQAEQKYNFIYFINHSDSVVIYGKLPIVYDQPEGN
jgi:hypothetical protein